MDNKPTLSIVVATTGDFSDHWLEQLLRIKGDVEFIIVYHPRSRYYPINEPRVKQIISPLRGELIQRLTGLFNAAGKYALDMNEDHFLHPDICGLIIKYFARFPESWVMRLNREERRYGDKEPTERDWVEIINIDKLDVCSRIKGNDYLFGEGKGLLEVPIAPLDKRRFDIRFIFWPFTKRIDHWGVHTEGFDQKVWKNSLVQESIRDLTQMINIIGPLKWVSFWCLDRLLGLYIQAKFFRKDIILGHWLPQPAQIINMDNPPERRRTLRFYVLADALLLKRFPQYAYFWNLVFDQLWAIPRRAFAYFFRKLIK